MPLPNNITTVLFYSYSQFFYDMQRYVLTHSNCAWVSAFDITIDGKRTTLLKLWDEHCFRYAITEADNYVEETKKYLNLIGSVN